MTNPQEPSPQEHWDAQYAGPEPRWSGRPNPVLVEVAAGLEPGTVLDLGCGEGGDAVWLADQGWRVTAVDVSATALARGVALAAARGDDVAGRIDWRHLDLASAFPEGTYDLVSAQYLHSTISLPRERILRRAAAAVAPGGTLLVVGHAAAPPWARTHDHAAHGHSHDHGHDRGFPTPDDVLADLALPAGTWTVDRADVVSRPATGPDGERGTLLDAVVAARRTP